MIERKGEINVNGNVEERLRKEWAWKHNIWGNANDTEGMVELLPDDPALLGGRQSFTIGEAREEIKDALLNLKPEDIVRAAVDGGDSFFEFLVKCCKALLEDFYFYRLQSYQKGQMLRLIIDIHRQLYRDESKEESTRLLLEELNGGVGSDLASSLSVGFTWLISMLGGVFGFGGGGEDNPSPITLSDNFDYEETLEMAQKVRTLINNTIKDLIKVSGGLPLSYDNDVKRETRYAALEYETGLLLDPNGPDKNSISKVMENLKDELKWTKSNLENLIKNFKEQDQVKTLRMDNIDGFGRAEYDQLRELLMNDIIGVDVFSASGKTKEGKIAEFTLSRLKKKLSALSTLLKTESGGGGSNETTLHELVKNSANQLRDCKKFTNNVISDLFDIARDAELANVELHEQPEQIPGISEGGDEAFWQTKALELTRFTKDKLKSVLQKIGELKNELTDRNLKIVQLMGDVTRMEGERKDEMEDTERLKERLESSIDELNNKYKDMSEKLEKDSADLIRIIGDLKTQGEEDQREEEEKTKELMTKLEQKHADEVTRLSSKLQKSTERMTDKLAELVALSALFEKNKIKTKKLKGDMLELIKKRDTEEDEMQRILEEKKKELELLLKDLEENKKKAFQLETDVNVLEKESEKLKNDLERRASELKAKEEEIKKLNGEIKEVKELEAQSLQMGQEALEYSSASEKRAEEAEEKVKECETKLKEAQEKVEELEKRLTEMPAHPPSSSPPSNSLGEFNYWVLDAELYKYGYYLWLCGGNDNDVAKISMVRLADTVKDVHGNVDFVIDAIKKESLQLRKYIMEEEKSILSYWLVNSIKSRTRKRCTKNWQNFEQTATELEKSLKMKEGFEKRVLLLPEGMKVDTDCFANGMTDFYKEMRSFCTASEGIAAGLADGDMESADDSFFGRGSEAWAFLARCTLFVCRLCEIASGPQEVRFEWMREKTDGKDKGAFFEEKLMGICLGCLGALVKPILAALETIVKIAFKGTVSTLVNVVTTTTTTTTTTTAASKTKSSVARELGSMTEDLKSAWNSMFSRSNVIHATYKNAAKKKRRGDRSAYYNSKGTDQDKVNLLTSFMNAYRELCIYENTPSEEQVEYFFTLFERRRLDGKTNYDKSSPTYATKRTTNLVLSETYAMDSVEKWKNTIRTVEYVCVGECHYSFDPSFIKNSTIPAQQWVGLKNMLRRRWNAGTCNVSWNAQERTKLYENVTLCYAIAISAYHRRVFTTFSLDLNLFVVCLTKIQAYDTLFKERFVGTWSIGSRQTTEPIYVTGKKDNIAEGDEKFAEPAVFSTDDLKNLKTYVKVFDRDAKYGLFQSFLYIKPFYRLQRKEAEKKGPSGTEIYYADREGALEGIREELLEGGGTDKALDFSGRAINMINVWLFLWRRTVASLLDLLERRLTDSSSSSSADSLTNRAYKQMDVYLILEDYFIYTIYCLDKCHDIMCEAGEISNADLLSTTVEETESAYPKSLKNVDMDEFLNEMDGAVTGGGGGALSKRLKTWAVQLHRIILSDQKEKGWLGTHFKTWIYIWAERLRFVHARKRLFEGTVADIKTHPGIIAFLAHLKLCWCIAEERFTVLQSNVAINALFELLKNTLGEGVSAVLREYDYDSTFLANLSVLRVTRGKLGLAFVQSLLNYQSYCQTLEEARGPGLNDIEGSDTSARDVGIVLHFSKKSNYKKSSSSYLERLDVSSLNQPAPLYEESKKLKNKLKGGDLFHWCYRAVRDANTREDYAIRQSENSASKGLNVPGISNLSGEIGYPPLLASVGGPQKQQQQQQQKGNTSRIRSNSENSDTANFNTQATWTGRPLRTILQRKKKKKKKKKARRRILRLLTESMFN